MKPRLGAALRFAATLIAVNLSALALFHNQISPTAASFATIGALYFLDYDGRARDRLGAYVVSTVIALIGLIIGAFAEGSLLATVCAALVIGFCFAAARAFRGLIARSFIGTQLAFVLAVFTGDASSHLSDLVWGWLWGAGLSTIAALVIFPRHNAGKLREALSQWCLAVALFLRAQQDVRAQALVTVHDKLRALDDINRGDMIAGLWSKRTRALAAMGLHVHQMTEFLELVPPLESIYPDQADLARTSAEAFENAAESFRLEGKRTDFARVIEARHAEFLQERERVAKLTDGSTISDSTHFNLRVISIAAESAQVLAAASHGWPHPEWPLVVDPEHSIASLARRTFSRDSIWLFHGLRTALALAGAIAIATLMGLEHGVWVVMTTLSVINVSFTTSGSSRNALGTIAGVLGGITVAATIIEFTHQWWTLVALLALLALLARWLLPTNGFLAQLSYTPLAVINVAMLGWPTRHGLTIVRVEDIVVGVLVAITATALTFPFGMKKLLEAVWLSARDAASAAISATRAALESGSEIPSNLVRAQALTFASATDAVDTVFAGRVQLGPELRVIEQRQRWLNLAILCQVGVAGLVQDRAALPPGDPGIKVLDAWGNDAFEALEKAAVT